LDRCLSLAEPEGYVRLFLDEGEPARELFAVYRRAGGVSPHLIKYAQRVLAAWPEALIGAPSGVAPGGTAIRPEPLAEPLTERELEVLRLIARGASNQEIAERLVVTLNTVKKHTSNLFGKLGVASRTQAIVRARELRLL
jgi:LuxR family maltose regulon positive regulatory protein